MYGSCSLNRQPWNDCGIKNCSQLFNNNGTCNPVCNNANCMFDGFDCDGPVTPCRYNFILLISRDTVGSVFGTMFKS